MTRDEWISIFEILSVIKLIIRLYGGRLLYSAGGGGVKTLTPSPHTPPSPPDYDSDNQLAGKESAARRRLEEERDTLRRDVDQLKLTKGGGGDEILQAQVENSMHSWVW